MDKEITRWEWELYYWSVGTAGSFYTSLVNTFMLADGQNSARMLMAFPDELGPVHRYRHESGYWEGLRAKIKNNQSK